MWSKYRHRNTTDAPVVGTDFVQRHSDALRVSADFLGDCLGKPANQRVLLFHGATLEEGDLNERHRVPLSAGDFNVAQSIEPGGNYVTRGDGDGFGHGSGKHDVTGFQPLPACGEFAHQPSDGRCRMSEYSGA